MKVAILYFSGTGNTEIVCKKWAEEAKKHDIECDLFKFEEIQDKKIDLSDYDKVGIGYPIHAFNAPKFVLKSAKKIVKSKTIKPWFAIMVSGEYMNLNHSSHLKLKSILRKRFMFLDSEYHYIMPYNMIFRHTEKRAYDMYKAMNVLVELDVNEYLVNNKPHALDKHKWARPLIWAFRIEQVYGPFYGKMLHINKKKCIKCMKCVNSCPLHNIEYKDGKFKFKFKCTLCARCSFNCPTNAFFCGFLQSWKVNGKYKFQEPKEVEIDRHPKYCKKSYERYYREAEKRQESIEK